MNQHYFDVPFGFSGDVTAIPDPLQTGGTVSFTEGWNYNYQRDLATDPAALPIDRSTMNWLLLQITTALQALQGETIPEFILASQNGGVAFSYGPQAEVLYSTSGNAPFAKYVNITGATNTSTPSSSDPLGTTTGWQLACDPIATAAQASAGTSNAAIMTPLLVAQQTALRALLAGNSSQVFNVGPAVSATQAPQFAQMTGLIGDSTDARINNSSAASASITYTATQLHVGTALNGLMYRLSSLNSTFTTTAANGIGGMDTGAAPASGWIALYEMYNPTTGVAGLMGQTVSSAPTRYYSGTHAPSGYAASALVGVVPTTSGGLVAQCAVRGNSVDIPAVLVINATTLNSSFTAQSIANAVPQGAKTVSGLLSVTGVSMQNGYIQISGYSNGLSYRQCLLSTPTTTSPGSGIDEGFNDVALSTSQTLYYATGAASVTGFNATAQINSYTF